MTAPFTVENILKVERKTKDEMLVITYLIGNTDSDCGSVALYLYDIGDEGDPQYDVTLEVDGDFNWGLGACASALALVAADFPTRFPNLKITDNTGL